MMPREAASLAVSVGRSVKFYLPMVLVTSGSSFSMYSNGKHTNGARHKNENLYKSVSFYLMNSVYNK